MSKTAKSLSRTLLALSASLVLAGAVLAQAQEHTARVIERLLAAVDEQLAGLETLSDRQAEQKQTWHQQLAAQLGRYDQAATPAERLACRRELVGAATRLNRAEWSETAAATETIVNICEAMCKLRAAVLSSSNLNPDKLREHQAQLNHFVHNVSRIVNTMEKLGGPKAAPSRHQAVKRSVAMLHRQLVDPFTGPGAAMTRIQETIRALEGVAIQLQLVQSALEREQALLTAGSAGVSLDSVLLRLCRAKAGADGEPAAALNQDRLVAERVRAALARLGQPISGDLAVSGPSVAPPYGVLAAK